MRRFLIIAGGVVALVLVAGFLFLRSLGMFADSAVYTTDRGAIDGYDPVAYFDSGRAVRGDQAHSLTWRGSRWLFASADNLNRFRQEPQRFAPQYGGYCAYGMANGYTAFTDPNAFSIVDDRLYLNFDTDVQAQWRADQAAMIEQADRNWPESRPARNAVADEG